MESLSSNAANSVRLTDRPLSFAVLEEPFSSLLGSVPDAVKGVHSMMTASEVSFLYNLTKRYYTGAGVIVDGGIFLGASTKAFGSGLLESPQCDEILKRWGKPIISLDRAIASEAMLTTIQRQGLGNTLRPGESFEPLINENIKDVAHVVDLRIGDILELGVIENPIEILFLDVLKSPTISLFAIEQYFVKLIPGKSVVIQQDYFIDGLAAIRVHQEALAHKFKFIGEIGASGIFLCTETIRPEEARIVGEQCRPLNVMCKNLEAACARSHDPHRRLLMEISQMRLLAYRGKMDASRAQLVKVEALISEIGESNLMPRLQKSVAGARYIATIRRRKGKFGQVV